MKRALIAVRRVASVGREKKRGAGHRLFANHADRDAFLNQFVHDYNHTRLKCLGYVAPFEALANLQGPNTFAGISAVWADGPISRPAIESARHPMVEGSSSSSAEIPAKAGPSNH